LQLRSSVAQAFDLGGALVVIHHHALAVLGKAATAGRPAWPAAARRSRIPSGGVRLRRLACLFSASAVSARRLRKASSFSA
jgi:hypothetical protein